MWGLRMKKTTMSLSQFSLKIKLYVGLAYACIRDHNVTFSVFIVNKNKLINKEQLKFIKMRLSLTNKFWTFWEDLDLDNYPAIF